MSLQNLVELEEFEEYKSRIKHYSNMLYRSPEQLRPSEMLCTQIMIYFEKNATGFLSSTKTSLIESIFYFSFLIRDESINLINHMQNSGSFIVEFNVAIVHFVSNIFSISTKKVKKWYENRLSFYGAAHFDSKDLEPLFIKILINNKKYSRIKYKEYDYKPIIYDSITQVKCKLLCSAFYQGLIESCKTIMQDINTYYNYY